MSRACRREHGTKTYFNNALAGLYVFSYPTLIIHKRLYTTGHIMITNRMHVRPCQKNHCKYNVHMIDGHHLRVSKLPMIILLTMPFTLMLICSNHRQLYRSVSNLYCFSITCYYQIHPLLCNIIFARSCCSY